MEENKEPVEGQEEGTPRPEEQPDRPEVNYQAELARKNAEIERLRLAQQQAEAQRGTKRDPTDISTWSDQELKMLSKSNDASVVQYKDQAEELLLERKVAAITAKKMEQQRRVESDLKLKDSYPESSDPSSDFSLKMEKVMHEYDLAKTPAGRLAAAKIVALEGKSSGDKANAKEKARVAALKANMVDGDRPKPTEAKDPNLDKKRKELADGLMDSRNEGRQVDAVAQILKDRGMTQDNFFKKK